MTAGVLAPLASSTLDLPPGSYIYSILERSGAYAVISSDDSLRLFDGATLRLQAGGLVERTHAGVTGLRAFDDAGNVWLTAGRDGFVRCWDLRSGKKAAEVRSGMVDPNRTTVNSWTSMQLIPCSGNGSPFLSLDCSTQRQALVTGSELHMSQASVVLWSDPSALLFLKPWLQVTEYASGM
jgi:WD40 repeat protein